MLSEAFLNILFLAKIALLAKNLTLNFVPDLSSYKPILDLSKVIRKKL